MQVRVVMISNEGIQNSDTAIFASMKPVRKTIITRGYSAAFAIQSAVVPMLLPVVPIRVCYNINPTFSGASLLAQS